MMLFLLPALFSRNKGGILTEESAVILHFTAVHFLHYCIVTACSTKNMETFVLWSKVLTM